MLMPAGNPVADQEYGPLPPDPTMVVAGYAAFTVATGIEAGPEMFSEITPIVETVLVEVKFKAGDTAVPPSPQHCAEAPVKAAV
jgi:hypothetical protein